MARVLNVHKRYEIIYSQCEKQPLLNQEVVIEEWDETGTTIIHNIKIIEIVNILPYKIGDEWMFKYTIIGR